MLCCDTFLQKKIYQNGGADVGVVGVLAQHLCWTVLYTTSFKESGKISMICSYVHIYFIIGTLNKFLISCIHHVSYKNKKIINM